MIILDLTNMKGKRPKSWPKSMPLKIRLAKGRYAAEYDYHPMVLKTKWYRELVRNLLKEYSHEGLLGKDPTIPVGVTVPYGRKDIKIIKTGADK